MGRIQTDSFESRKNKFDLFLFYFPNINETVEQLHTITFTMISDVGHTGNITNHDVKSKHKLDVCIHKTMHTFNYSVIVYLNINTPVTMYSRTPT